MLKPLRQFIRARSKAPLAKRTPDGERYYVIGDIHGRLDLFQPLVDAIERDAEQFDGEDATIILLGDLVDRGPDSAGVVRYARDLQQRRKVRILAGNHEEMFLQSFEDIEVLRHFLKFGGRETLLSYGLDRSTYNAMTLEELFERIQTLVPQDERDFIAGFEELIVAGDYVFVHAGIDPTKPVENQKRSDKLWIRERFLRHDKPLSHVIVHGHTIFDEVEIRDWRIGIDTGAYNSGRLTALVLEDDKRRLLTANQMESGAVDIQQRNILA